MYLIIVYEKPDHSGIKAASGKHNLTIHEVLILFLKIEMKHNPNVKKPFPYLLFLYV